MDEHVSAREEATSAGVVWVPRLMLATSGMHVALGAVTFRPEWRTIARRGVCGSVHDDRDATASALWFMVSGAALFGLGLLTRKHVGETGRLPKETGYTLLVLGVPVSLLQPASGGWLLVGMGGLALVVSNKE